VIFSIEYIKKIRLSILHFLSGEFPNKRVEGVKLTNDGLPKVLGPLIKDLRMLDSPTSIMKLRLLLTLLFSTRALNLGREVDITSIKEPTKVVPKGGNLDYKKHIISFWSELGYSRTGFVPRTLNWKKFHFTTKSGPNGHALWTSMNDLWLIPEKDLIHISYLGGPKLRATMENLLSFKDSLKPMFSFLGTVRRSLSYFPDKELKVRVVAICDYWSQTALIPLHKYLFRVLRKIPQDCTFSQSSFLTKIQGWEEFYSIDLTAATDRFPINFEYLVLNGNLPDKYCHAWKHVMVGTPFRYKDRNNIITDITYGAGNPMGLYSSWNSFTVSHHYVMFYCCKELGIPFKNAKYVMLGDDVLIGDHRLAFAYKEFIKGLGVEFSDLKTHESKTLCEFAKRLVYNGQEITPFPISSIKESAKRFYLLVNLLSEQIERGWIPLKGIPETIFDFYKIVKKRNSKFSRTLSERSYTCELIMKMMRGSISASDAFNSTIRKYKLPVSEFTEQDSREFLNGFLYEAFIKSDPQYSDSKEPLGLLAQDLVTKITGIEDVEDFERLFSVPQQVPLLNCYGQIEEAWLKLRKEADGLLDRPLVDWTIVTRMTIPLSDRVFVERQSHSVARVSAIMGDKLLPALRQLCHRGWDVYFPS
jgi:hypothetical protein